MLILQYSIAATGSASMHTCPYTCSRECPLLPVSATYSCAYTCSCEKYGCQCECRCQCERQSGANTNAMDFDVGLPKAYSPPSIGAWHTGTSIEHVNMLEYTCTREHARVHVYYSSTFVYLSTSTCVHVYPLPVPVYRCQATVYHGLAG